LVALKFCSSSSGSPESSKPRKLINLFINNVGFFGAEIILERLEFINAFGGKNGSDLRSFYIIFN